MSAIKLHVFRTELGDDGTLSCDYRGAGDAYGGPTDQHRTVAEIDPATEEQVEMALELGPRLNMLLKEFYADQPDFAWAIAGLLGLEGDGPIGLRIGVGDQ